MKTTGTYRMKNIITGKYQTYYLWKREQRPINTKEALQKQLDNFPAYREGVMVLDGDLIILDYKGRCNHETI